MPVYEYKCTGCGSRFDLLQSMDAEKTAGCEECGCEAKRVFSPRIAIKYRGWGFNSTDKLLPESSRSQRDFKQISEKAEQLMSED